MCWVSSTMQKHTALHKIPVCKICHLVIEEGYVIQSMYYSHKYKLNKLYKQQVPIVERATFGERYIINEGFHSYSKDVTIGKQIDGLEGTCICISYKGNELDWFRAYNSLIKVNGYIPEGSVYFVNDIGEYVSEALVLTDYEVINERHRA